MQEGQVGWDPSTFVPWYVRLCLIYLLVIVAIAIIHSVRLSWRLWSFPNRKRLNSDLLASDSFDPDIAAAMVLSGRPESPAGKIEGVASTHLRATRRSIASLAAACREITAGLKRKANYGVAFSLIAVVLRTIDVSKEISTQKIAGVGILAGSLSEILVPLEAALIIATTLHITANYFDGLRRRRMRDWRYFQDQIALREQ